MAERYPAPGTPLPFEHALNFRELGGYPAANGRHVRHGLLWRSGALDNIVSAADVRRFEGLGVRYILDLRSVLEAAAQPDRIPAGARYERICAMRFLNGDEIDFSPAGIARLAAEGAELAAQQGGKEPDMFAELYARMPLHNPAYQALFDAMAAGEVPLLFHCAAGKDRTGVAGMLILLALGADRGTALQDYMQTNVCRKPLIDADLQRHAAQWAAADAAGREAMLAREGVIRRMAERALDTIETRYPSYEAFFAAEYGLDAPRLAALREAYLE